MSWQNNYLQFKNHYALDGVMANQQREKAFNQFINEGLPTKKEEAWKFTALTDFKNTEWKTNEDVSGLLTHEQMQEISKQLPTDFINYVFINGVLNKTLSDDLDTLVEVVELEEADFSLEAQDVEARLLNLAQAFLNKKINLSVVKNRSVDRPVHILFVQSSKESVYLSEKLNINLAENSEIKILINTISFINSTPDAINLNVNINVQNSARLTLIQLQNEDTGSFHFSQCNMQVASSASVNTLVLSLGNKLTRNYYRLKFNGENSNAGVYGLGVLDLNQHVDNYTYLQHATGANNSIQHYKTILSGQAHSVFRGRVLIEPNAQKANSEQLNNNLLLTRNAQADSVPQLEIFADDVKASHGATFGQLNKDEVFYFLSRGINQFQAVKMLSYGFVVELVFKIENEALQKYILNILNKKLEHLVQNAQ